MHSTRRYFGLGTLTGVSSSPLTSPSFPTRMFDTLLVGTNVSHKGASRVIRSVTSCVSISSSPHFRNTRSDFCRDRAPPQRDTGRVLFLANRLHRVGNVARGVCRQLVPCIYILPAARLDVGLGVLARGSVPLFETLFLGGVASTSTQILLRGEPERN